MDRLSALARQLDALFDVQPARAPLSGSHAQPTLEDPAAPLVRDAQNRLGNQRVAAALSGGTDLLDTLLHDALALATAGIAAAHTLDVVLNPGALCGHLGEPNGDGGQGSGADFASVLAMQRAPGDPEDGIWGEPAREAVHGAEGKGARALPPAVRERLERTLGGADLSAMRVHTGPEAARAADAIHAEAYTMGFDVYFSGGAYQPDLDQGLRLLAHEATHVVQHQEGRLQREAGSDDLSVTSPGDAVEVEAEQVARALAPAASESSETSAPAAHETESLATGSEGQTSQPARFSKENHEEVENDGFDGLFNAREKKQIYRGNWEQDLSQLTSGAAVGFVEAADALMETKEPGQVTGQAKVMAKLLNDLMNTVKGVARVEDVSEDLLGALGRVMGIAGPSADQYGPGAPFGGYQPTAHMDRPDAATSSSEVIEGSRAHILTLLESALIAGHTEVGLNNLGAACHTIEDYFAHSSFVEVANGERDDIQMSIYDPALDKKVTEMELVADYMGRLERWSGRMLGLEKIANGQLPPHPANSGVSTSNLCVINTLAPLLAAQFWGKVSDLKGNVKEGDPDHAADHHSFLAKDQKEPDEPSHNTKVDQAKGMAAAAIHAVSAPLVESWWPDRDNRVESGDLSAAMVNRMSVHPWREPQHIGSPAMMYYNGLTTAEGDKFVADFRAFYESLLATWLPTDGGAVRKGLHPLVPGLVPLSPSGTALA